MNTNFQELPDQLRIPLIYVQWDASQASTGSNPFRYRNVIIGQKLGTGTQEAEKPVRIARGEQARRYFGPGSMLSAMCDALLKQHPFADLWAIAIDDRPQAKAAQGNITIQGQAEEDTTVSFLIAGKQINLQVFAGEVDTVLIARLQELCRAQDDLPVESIVDGEIATQLNLSSKHTGEIGNSRTLVLVNQEQMEVPAGLIIQFTYFTGGSGNPDITPALSQLDDSSAQLIVCPYADTPNLQILAKELNDRHQPLQQQDILSFSAANGTFGEMSTLGEQNNSPYLSIMTAHASPTPPYCWAAGVAGVVSRYAENDPARPFQTLPLQNILPPARENRLTLEECNQLLFSGISTFTVSGTDTVHIQRLITTYQTNHYGTPDVSYLDLNTLLTLGYLRRDFRQHLMNKYARHKLADDDTNFAPGEPILTPKVAKAEAIAKFREWEERGLVQDMAQFQEDLVVERHRDDPNRLDITLAPRLMNQLRVISVQLQFLL